MTASLSLFPELPAMAANARPVGLSYADKVIPQYMQADLIGRAGTLDFAPFDFRGFTGNRRTVAFGSRYDFSRSRVCVADPLPDWLLPFRGIAGWFADIPEDKLVQALITEYAPGAGIGWHRDRPEYGKIVGMSFGSDCVLRFRRPEAGGWRRAAQALRPGSAYLLDGPARREWQHSITPGDQLRYSVTFRSMQ